MIKKLIIPMMLCFVAIINVSVFGANTIVETIGNKKVSEYEKSLSTYVEPEKTDVISYIITPYDTDKVFFDKLDLKTTYPYMDGYSVYYKPVGAGYKQIYEKTTDIVVLSKEQFDNINVTNLPKNATVINDGGNAIVIIPNSNKVPAFYIEERDRLGFKEAVSNSNLNVQPYQLNNADGYVTGVNVDYKFNFPKGTDFNVYNRTHLDDTNAVEKLAFIPATKGYKEKESVIMELYVYNKNDFFNIIGQFKVGEDDEHIYSVKAYPDTSFVTVSGKELYNDYYKILSENLFKNVADGLVTKGEDNNLVSVNENINENTTQQVEETEKGKAGKSVYIDGKLFEIDVIKDGDTFYIPARPVLEALGYTVGWEQKTSSITATKGDNINKFKINSKTYNHNGNDEILEYAPVKVGATTFIPIEAINVLTYNYFVIGDAIYIKSE